MKWPRLPDYGYIPRWPEDGTDFIHPEDVSEVAGMFPGYRVFRRDSFNGRFFVCSYGKIRFRLRSCLWTKVKGDGIDIGQRVETTGICMSRELFVGRVRSMQYSRRERSILYGLERNGVPVPQPFRAHELRPIGLSNRMNHEYLRSTG